MASPEATGAHRPNAVKIAVAMTLDKNTIWNKQLVYFKQLAGGECC